MNADPLDWLLPEAAAEERAVLRRVVQALRLLRTELARPGTRSVAPAWPRARGELEELARREGVRALETVLVAHLAALRPADSFLPLPPTRMGLDEAWRLLLARRLGAPAPPTTPLAAAARALLERGRALGVPDFWEEYWSLALAHVERGPVPARWERALERVRAGRARPRVLARFLGGLAASALERGAPARALATLRAYAPLFAFEPELARLAHWSALVLGLPAGQDPLPTHRLPLPLVELAGADARFGACLRGTPATEGGCLPASDRRPEELGAEVALLWKPARAGLPRLLAAHGLGRAASVRAARSPRLAAAFSESEPRFERLGPEEPGGLADAAGGARMRARAFVPLRAQGGTRLLWHLEWPHALLPGRQRLLAWAARAAQDAGRGRCVGVAGRDPRARLARVLRAQLRRLGVERFACFAPGGEREPFALVGLERRRVERARMGAGPEAGLDSFELGPARGAGVRVFVEAGRPTAGLARALAPLAEPLLAASFRAHERARGRVEPWWEPHSSSWAAAQALDFVGPWCVVGPEDSGRGLVARWLLYRAGFDPEDPARIRRGAPVALTAGSVWIGTAAPEPAPGGVARTLPLAARRTELAAILAQRAEQVLGVDVLTEEARAVLWRQAWAGGWRELERVLAALASHASVRAAEVRAVLQAEGIPCLERRVAPPAEELQALLLATRHGSGNLNLARAARWLGWRAEALAREVARLGLGDAASESPCGARREGKP